MVVSIEKGESILARLYCRRSCARSGRQGGVSATNVGLVSSQRKVLAKRTEGVGGGYEARTSQAEATVWGGGGVLSNGNTQVIGRTRRREMVGVRAPRNLEKVQRARREWQSGCRSIHRNKANAR